MTQVLFTKTDCLSDAPPALLKLSECPHFHIIYQHWNWRAGEDKVEWILKETQKRERTFLFKLKYDVSFTTLQTGIRKDFWGVSLLNTCNSLLFKLS